ncbi:hypothetical protein CYMTET_49783 [Cymbomonas tetramitiformis]|uniref:Lipocalin/cytosolic fatty-acid binding domain-containing protein n=1 Tax=Cymbomonas tetramitiformis TaxID=36881 RepID=A0AAE0BPG8_9CHLO|nr:hypothetical protein CYMTET_49783 [Cymbomonas tetramitiformis]
MGLGASKLPPLRTVAEVDVQKFMGEWYVVGTIPTYFEIGACNPKEVYTWNEAKKVVNVQFTFNKNTLDGAISSIPQTLYPAGYKGGLAPVSGSWQVSPFWPVRLSYLIMDIADDYRYTVIGYPTREYLWIMSRSTTIAEEDYSKVMELVKEQGYDLSKIIKPLHSSPQAGKKEDLF